MAMAEDKKQIVQEFKLEQDNELRFEVETKLEKVILTLKSGTAEVYGTELVKGKAYEFTAGAKIAVFTWQGCSLELKGKTDVSYIAKETPMVLYANCHAALDLLRVDAEKNNTNGPVCMVVGPQDVGKSTITRILLNYAVRVGRRPIYIDLDVGQGAISVPGTLGALLIERPALVEESFSEEAPLVYHYGLTSPRNSSLFKLLLTELANVVKERMQANKRTKMSGCIINTCGWIKGVGYTHLLHAARAFKVDVILVMDQERLFNELVRDLPKFVKVVFIPKSGGVVERNRELRREVRDQRIREYFYGSPKNPLYPHSFDLKWSDIKIFKIGAPALPDSCLPLGMTASDHLTKLVALTPNPGMLHHLLSISYAEKDDDDMIKHHCHGFVCITHVDMERQCLTVLSPQPKPLPNNLLILSEVQFMDSH